MSDKPTMGKIEFDPNYEGRYQYEKPVRVLRRKDIEHLNAMDDDLRRLCLSLINFLKRAYPNDYRRILSEMVVE